MKKTRFIGLFLLILVGVTHGYRISRRRRIKVKSNVTGSYTITNNSNDIIMADIIYSKAKLSVGFNVGLKLGISTGISSGGESMPGLIFPGETAKVDTSSCSAGIKVYRPVFKYFSDETFQEEYVTPQIIQKISQGNSAEWTAFKKDMIFMDKVMLFWREWNLTCTKERYYWHGMNAASPLEWRKG